MDFNLPRNCEKCDKEFNYDDPSSTADYYVVELRNSNSRGSSGSLVYCMGCAPFGNTSIPRKLGVKN
jgi:hypothetical protein